jgi:spermidine synthase
MAFVKKIISWIFPFRIKRIEGKISPVLEISFENGKKVLNAGDVNYSFGALHQVFRIALQKAKIIEHPPSDVLILGFGAGSIASILIEEYGQQPNIIGVEADPVVIHLAKTEFNCDRFESLEIENTTAEKFISENKSQFDLIAVDVFVEANVPETCKTESFLRNLYAGLKKNGRVVFNEMPSGNFSGQNDFARLFITCFDQAEIYELHVGGTPNKMLIGYRNKE